MFKKLLVLFLVATLFFFRETSAFALERLTFVTFINPVRGAEGWGNRRQDPLDLPKFQYQNATSSAYPISWLLRFDAVKDATISAFFSKLSNTDGGQTLGAFLEITPNLTAAAKVDYPAGTGIFDANRIFLSGYSQPERIKLIDAYMNLFFQKFGYYPRVVGAWHIDAYSITYLKNHYSVELAVICDNQYSTDRYRLWGSYFGSPYVSSRQNVLIPSTSREDSSGMVIAKWAQRDFFNGHKNDNASWYSFQVNDYGLLNLKTNYFEKLLGVYSDHDFNEFTQVTVGIENDYPLAQYKNEIRNTYKVLNEARAKYNLHFVSTTSFADFMHARYSVTSPAFFYQSTDPTEKRTGKVFWYQNPFYRIGFFSDQGKTKILDFRLYNSADAEPYYLTKNTSDHLFMETNPIIDTVKYPETDWGLDVDLTKAKISYENWKVTFSEGDKLLRLTPSGVVFSNITPPDLNTGEIKVINKGRSITWKLDTHLPFTTNKLTFYFAFLVILLFALSLSHSPLYLVSLALGAITLITVWGSGRVYSYGMGFWGPNGHDALFHLSLINHFKQNLFSLAHPQIYDLAIKNYHIGLDWLTGLVASLTTLSQLDLFMRYLPLLIVILLVYFLLKLLKKWQVGTLAALISVTMVFLSGSAGFLVTLFTRFSIVGGESLFWANQSVSLLLNPPFALSILILVIFFFLYDGDKRLTLKELLFFSLLGGVTAQIKVYAFLLLFASLVINRKFKLAFGVGLVGAIFLLPTLGNDSSPFLFSPLWFSRSLFEAHDRLYYAKLATAWQSYENSGQLGKLILVNLFAVVIFYLGNLWTRVIVLFRLREFNKPSQSLINGVIVLGLVTPLLFIQKVNPWNTIQFLYYSIFFLSLYTGPALVTLLHRCSKVTKLILVLIFVVVSVPTTIGTLSDYLTSQSASRISLTELRALDVLRRSPPGTVVSPLVYDRYYSPVPDPRPQYVYVSSAYISALSGHPEYLSDTINLDITGYDYKQRAKRVIRLYQTTSPDEVTRFLTENRITYLYETPVDRLKFPPENACLIKIFDSGEINLYKYSCHG